MSELTLEKYLVAGVEELGSWLRNGQTSPQELVELALTALKERAEPLNAVVNLAPERARVEAARATESLKSNRAGPLTGLPYGAKDLLATGGGLPTTWGAAPLREQQFDEDATVLRLLQNSGAVLTAKLAMVELAGGMGYNQPNASLTGPGKNPWNPERWSGGSSSGSAAAVGCGALPFALGSETWGSILSPASYCGVVGVRPTYGLVSRHGAMALSWSLDKIGPYARSVSDAAQVLQVIGQPDRADPTSSGREFFFRPHMFTNHRWRFGIVEAEVENAEGEVGQTVEAAIGHLEKIGTVKKISLAALPYAEVARIMIYAEASAAFEDFIEAGQVSGLTAPEDRVNPYSFETILAKDYIRALRVRHRIVTHLSEVLAEVDFLVAPTTATTAVPIDQPFNLSMGQRRMTQLSAASNLAGLPAVSLPVGFSRQGLPVGMQLVGDAFGDEGLLAAASRLEKLLNDTK